MEGRVLDFLALGIFIFVVITIVYAIIYIHDIPYEIAKKRNHPHQDAIHTAGWVSLFLMYTIWPFLWIWATMYKPEIGWGFSGKSGPVVGTTGGEPAGDLSGLVDRIAELEKREKQLQTAYDRQLNEMHDRLIQMEEKAQPGKEV